MDESWVSVAQFSDPLSARVASGRLTSEDIPSAVSRPPFSAGLYYLRVPPESVDAAKRILEASARLDETELTRLALQEPPPDDYVPSTTTSTTKDPRDRRLAVMMPVGSGVLFLVTAGSFWVILARVLDKGVQYPTICSPAGCRNSLGALIASGLMALLTLGMFLASLGVGKQDK